MAKSPDNNEMLVLEIGKENALNQSTKNKL